MEVILQENQKQFNQKRSLQFNQKRSVMIEQKTYFNLSIQKSFERTT